MKNNIDRLRKQAGLTVQALADEVGVSRVYLSDLKDGRKDLNGRIIAKLAKALRCEPHEILGTSDEEAGLVPVIGEVPGGDWREALAQHIGDFVYFKSGKKNLFGLYVRGTSINKVAADGAVVIVDADARDPSALTNQLVVVMINRHGVWEATCKVYKTNPDRFEPHSTEAHDTIFPGGDEWAICGRVVGAVAYVHNFGELLDVRNKSEYLKLLESA